MPTIKYAELHRRYELNGAAHTTKHFAEALAKGHLKADDFSIRDLAEALVPDGREWVRMLDPRSGSGNLALLEAQGAVTTAAFSNITGQIVYSRIMEKYQSEDYIFSKLIRATPTRLNGEKIPGVTQLGDKGDVVGENQEYPTVGVSEDYVETPMTTKRGLIVPVTKEAIFFDRTDLVLSRASEVGESLAIGKEKRLIDMIIGVTNTYKWKGTAYSTYQATTPWINSKTGSELVDWTDVDEAEQLFTALIDPNTGEPIMITPKHMVVHRVKKYTARRVVGATEIGVETPGFATSGNPTLTKTSNPIQNYEVLNSQLLNGRYTAASLATTTWFLGDLQKAFAYMENWPITVAQAMQNNEAEFTHDVVARFKASERGAPAVMEPRAVVKVAQ